MPLKESDWLRIGIQVGIKMFMPIKNPFFPWERSYIIISQHTFKVPEDYPVD